LKCQKHSLNRQSGTKSLVKPTCNEKMTVLSTFLESSLNFLSNDIKNATKSGKVSEKSSELPETQFERTVRDKITYKTYLEWENDCFKYIFGILIKFPI